MQVGEIILLEDGKPINRKDHKIISNTTIDVDGVDGDTDIETLVGWTTLFSKKRGYHAIDIHVTGGTLYLQVNDTTGGIFEVATGTSFTKTVMDGMIFDKLYVSTGGATVTASIVLSA